MDDICRRYTATSLNAGTCTGSGALKTSKTSRPGPERSKEDRIGGERGMVAELIGDEDGGLDLSVGLGAVFRLAVRGEQG